MTNPRVGYPVPSCEANDRGIPPLGAGNTIHPAGSFGYSPLGAGIQPGTRGRVTNEISGGLPPKSQGALHAHCIQDRQGRAKPRDCYFVSVRSGSVSSKV